jgi:hypothetical protein
MINSSGPCALQWAPGAALTSVHLQSCTEADQLHVDLHVLKTLAAQLAAELHFHAKCSKIAAIAAAAGATPPLCPSRLQANHSWQERMQHMAI